MTVGFAAVRSPRLAHIVLLAAAMLLPAPVVIGHEAAASRHTTRAIAVATAGDTLGAKDDSAVLLAARALIIPIASVPRARLRDTFSEGRGAKGHEAIDIAAPRGTPVLAVDDGRIVKLFHSIPGGNTVYQFDPGDRFAYYYAHLDAYAEGLKEGVPVTRGQVIGYVGTTGNAAPDAPHLHFAIFRLGPERHWWQGTPVNPYAFLNEGER